MYCKNFCMPSKNREKESASEKPFTLTVPRFDLGLKEASELPFFSLCDEIWDLVVNAAYASHFNDDSSNRPEAKYATMLPEHWQVAYAIHAMEYDVLEGGFDTFFENHSDLLNPILEHGLGLIGATAHQKIFQEAVKCFANNESLYDLDSEFYEACRTHSDPRELLAAFILINHSKFTA